MLRNVQCIVTELPVCLLQCPSELEDDTDKFPCFQGQHEKLHDCLIIDCISVHKSTATITNVYVIPVLKSLLRLY